MSDDEISIEQDIFAEPEDFRPPPPESHFSTYTRKIKNAVPAQVEMKLVGKSPLWGHLLWNAGISIADFLDEGKCEVRGKRVLELGAAGALPSLICALNGASKVISTDYPDADLISHIQWSFSTLEEAGYIKKDAYDVKGYIWGNNLAEVVYGESDKTQIEEEDKFDLIILSDLVFNHTEHHKLLESCRKGLKKDGKCLVAFSPHRAHLLDKDLEFFTTCEEYDFKAEKIDLTNWKPMFEEDNETAEVRSRVYKYYLLPQW